MALLRGVMALFSFACLIGMVPETALGKTVGQVVKATSGATVESGNRRLRAVARMAISQGDVVNTDKTGSVQIIFVDDTRVAVGPNSTFAVDEVAMRTRNRANRFAVTAVKGTFRFISGQSRKEAYEVTTPIATMGIRGTVFDFRVFGSRQLDIALLEGSIRACRNRGNRCARISGNCAIASTTQFGGFNTPNTRDEFDRFISTSFPFIRNQSPLVPQLQTDVRSCARVRASLRSDSGEPVQRNRTVNPPAPRTPEPDRTQERQTDETPSDPGRQDRSERQRDNVFTRPADPPDNRSTPGTPPQPPGPSDPEPPGPPDPEPPEPPDPEPPEPPDPGNGGGGNRSGGGDGTNPGGGGNPGGSDNPGNGAGGGNRSGGGDGTNPGGGGNPGGSNNPGGKQSGGSGGNGNPGKSGEAKGKNGNPGNSGNAPGKNK